jgi:hypothetical protein
LEFYPVVYGACQRLVPTAMTSVTPFAGWNHRKYG